MVYYNVMVNIPMCYSNPTIINMYWHYRKLVYKIIVNERDYRITYFIAGYWIYSRPLSAYIVLNQPILLKNFPQKKSCWRTPVLRGKKMPNGGDAVFKLHSFDQFRLRQLVFSSMCFHFRHIKSWKLLKRREKKLQMRVLVPLLVFYFCNCKCLIWYVTLWTWMGHST